MPAFAFGLSCPLSRKCHSTQYVFPVRDRFQVGRIDATGIPAQVIYLHAFGDWPFRIRVSPDVCSYPALFVPRPSACQNESAITVPIPISTPLPATNYWDDEYFSPESVTLCLYDFEHGRPPAPVTACGQSKFGVCWIFQRPHGVRKRLVSYSDCPRRENDSNA